MKSCIKILFWDNNLLSYIIMVLCYTKQENTEKVMISC